MITAHCVQFSDMIICGNQKWKGANPAFKERAIIIIISDETIKYKLYTIMLAIKFIIIKKDAIAWIRKYLIPASEK